MKEAFALFTLKHGCLEGKETCEVLSRSEVKEQVQINCSPGPEEKK